MHCKFRKYRWYLEMAVLPLASVELEHLKFERSLTDSSQLARLP